MSKHYMLVGATSGLGYVAANFLKNTKTKISILGRKNLKENNNFYFCDLENINSFDSVLDQVISDYGKLDGIVFFQRYRGKKNNWDSEILTSLTSTKYIIEKSMNFFSDKVDKSLVFISSVNSSFISPNVSLGYHVSKSGINSLAKYYAQSLGHLKVRSNIICPGTFIKPENKSYFLNNNLALESLKSLSPLNKVTDALEICELIKFLLSKKSSAITGQSFIIDSGVSIAWPEGRN